VRFGEWVKAPTKRKMARRLPKIIAAEAWELDQGRRWKMREVERGVAPGGRRSPRLMHSMYRMMTGKCILLAPYTTLHGTMSVKKTSASTCHKRGRPRISASGLALLLFGGPRLEFLSSVLSRWQPLPPGSRLPLGSTLPLGQPSSLSTASSPSTIFFLFDCPLPFDSPLPLRQPSSPSTALFPFDCPFPLSCPPIFFTDFSS